MDKKNAREIYKLLAKIDKVCMKKDSGFEVGGCAGCPMNELHTITKNGGITTACSLIDWARVYEVDGFDEDGEEEN